MSVLSHEDKLKLIEMAGELAEEGGVELTPHFVTWLERFIERADVPEASKYQVCRVATAMVLGTLTTQMFLRFARNEAELTSMMMDMMKNLGEVFDNMQPVMAEMLKNKGSKDAVVDSAGR